MTQSSKRVTTTMCARKNAGGDPLVPARALQPCVPLQREQ